MSTAFCLLACMIFLDCAEMEKISVKKVDTEEVHKLELFLSCKQ